MEKSFLIKRKKINHNFLSNDWDLNWTTSEERKNSKHYVNTTIFLELYVVPPPMLDTFFFLRWQPKEPNKQPKEKKFFFNGELRSVK